MINKTLTDRVHQLRKALTLVDGTDVARKRLVLLTGLLNLDQSPDPEIVLFGGLGIGESDRALLDTPGPASDELDPCEIVISVQDVLVQDVIPKSGSLVVPARSLLAKSPHRNPDPATANLCRERHEVVLAVGELDLLHTDEDIIAARNLNDISIDEGETATALVTTSQEGLVGEGVLVTSYFSRRGLGFELVLAFCEHGFSKGVTLSELHCCQLNCWMSAGSPTLQLQGFHAYGVRIVYCTPTKECAQVTARV